MVQAGFCGAAEFFSAGALPREVVWIDPKRPEPLTCRRWDLLTLTAGGCAGMELLPLVCACGTLLVPGDCGEDVLQRIRAERVVSFGISGRDSLTFSSMGEEQRVLCIQRELLLPDGGVVDRQEIPLPEKYLILPDEAILALMGTRLLLYGAGSFSKEMRNQ